MDLRPYRGADEGALLALWNATLTHDAITPATFRTKVLLDPNFNPDGLLVADGDGANGIAGAAPGLSARFCTGNRWLLKGGPRRTHTSQRTCTLTPIISDQGRRTTQ